MYELSVCIGDRWYRTDDLYSSHEAASTALLHVQKQVDVEGFRIVRSA